MKELTEAAERFLDEVGAYIILSGGCATSKGVLKSMRIEEFLHMLYNNGIRLEVTSTKLKKQAPSYSPPAHEAVMPWWLNPLSAPRIMDDARYTGCRPGYLP